MAVLALLVLAAGVATAQSTFPVPREKAVVVETDMKYQYFNTANPMKDFGTQWGSGWHQVVEEWDWYMDYATGERILWRTTGWEYAADNMSLTWHVRKGVTWNDGVPYTAQDIVYTFNLWLKDPSMPNAGTADNVASVTAPDDYTVIFKFKSPEYRFHQRLRMWGGGGIIAKHIYEKQDIKTFANWPPVETGPYKLQGWYQDNQMYVWQADPNYWGAKVMGKKPGPQYVIFRSAPPPDLDLAEFVKGNVDMPLPHIFTIDMIRAAEKQWTHTVRSPYMDAVSTGIAGFNTAKAPGSDREFRWTMQYLINREKLRKIYPLADSTDVTMWPWPHWATLGKWEIPAVKTKYLPNLRYDPVFAAKELDRLGYKKGSNGMRTLPDGTPFTLTLVSGAAPDYNYLVAKDFSDELTKIGIDNVLKIFGAGINDQQFGEGQYDILFDVLDIGAAFPNDVFQMIDSFNSRWAKPIGTLQNQGDRARSRLQDPALDAIDAKLARMNPDDPKYLDLVSQALDRWYYDLPAVPATEKTFIQTLSDKYWTNWPVPGNMYQVPYQWWPSMIFIMFGIKPVG